MKTMDAAGYSSFADWAMSENFRPLLKQHHAVGELRCSFLRVALAEAIPDPPTADLTLQMIIGGGMPATVDLGAGRFGGNGRRGSFFLGPARVPLDIEGRGRTELIVLAFREERLKAAAEETCARAVPDFRQLHGSLHCDEPLATLLQWVWSELEHGLPYGKLFADGALTRIIARLLAHSGANPIAKETVLPLWQIKRIRAAVEDNGFATLGLADLAKLAGLSPFHFARAFKASTGMPPHQYQVRLKLGRAQQMLSSTKLSVTDIAHACGFASSQHMATVFRRIVGAAPSAYRRERLS